MANAFDALLEDIADESDRKVLQNLGEKYREVKEGYLRQADYSKKSSDLQADKKAFESEKSNLEGKITRLESLTADWNAWRADHWVDLGDGSGKTKEQIEVEEELDRSREELETLKAAQEAGMTFEEVGDFIKKDMEKRGVITKGDLDSRFVDEASWRNSVDGKDLKGKLIDASFYKKDTAERITGVANGLQYLVVTNLPLMFQHKDEFGEIMQPEDLIKFANEKGYRDIKQAYDAWILPRREEARTKKYKEEIELAEKRGEEKALKNRGTSVDGKMPVDQGPPQMTPFQERLRKAAVVNDKGEIPEEVKLGEGLGLAVAERFRKDQAEGKVLAG